MIDYYSSIKEVSGLNTNRYEPKVRFHAGEEEEMGGVVVESNLSQILAKVTDEENDDTVSVTSSASSLFSTANPLFETNTPTPAAPIRLPFQRRMSNPFSWKFDDDSNIGHNSRGGVYRQIRLDVDRSAGRPLILSQHRIRIRLCRALFLWSVRHPACGYVQGMHDVFATLFIVFLSGYIGNTALLDEKCEAENQSSSSSSSLHLDDVPDQLLDAVEADAYWCLTNLMWSIQDHYTADQPGLQRMVFLLEDLVRRLDPPLAQHFKKERMEFLWFAFRWMNCLLARDLNWRCLTRMWDTCLSEDGGGRSSTVLDHNDVVSSSPSSHSVKSPSKNNAIPQQESVGSGGVGGVQVSLPSWDGFDYFHVYVCVALLHRFSERLQTMAFEDLFYFLQNLPTKNWEVQEMEQLLSQAYAWRTTFRGYEERIIFGRKDAPTVSNYDSNNDYIRSRSISFEKNRGVIQQTEGEGEEQHQSKQEGQEERLSYFLRNFHKTFSGEVNYSADVDLCLDL